MPAVLNACFIDPILPRVDEYCKCFLVILKTFVKMHKYRTHDLDKSKVIGTDIFTAGRWGG